MFWACPLSNVRKAAFSTAVDALQDTSGGKWTGSPPVFEGVGARGVVPHPAKKRGPAADRWPQSLVPNERSGTAGRKRRGAQVP